MNAQSNPHTGAAAAAAAISSRLGGVSKLGRALVILQQPEHCGALVCGLLSPQVACMQTCTHRGLTSGDV